MWLLKLLLCTCLIFHVSKATSFDEDISEGDFAEFEEFDEEVEAKTIKEDVPKEKPSSFKETVDEKPEIFESDDDEGEVELEDDDSEFEHFQDVEEFEGFDEKGEKVPLTEPKITIANVPFSFRQNWENYYLEFLMLTGVMVYFMNFILGKSKNNKIANAWFQTHKQLLEENFALVGDDGNLEKSENVTFVKQSESVFNLWCSGRTCCEGMLVELKLIKRQDLVQVLAFMMRPSIDQIHVTVRMNKEDMDNFIFAVATKKTAIYLSRDMADISVYCPDRKAGEKFNIPQAYQVMSEISEATSAMLDSKIISILNKYTEYIDYIHFSDQYSGVKQPEEVGSTVQLKRPDTQKVLMFGFNCPIKGMTVEESMEKIKPMMNMVFYFIDKVKRYRLSKEGKSKSDKNRLKVEEAFHKSTLQARAEAAALKREEKRKQEKEKVMALADPERQRRWELKEEKRQAKKKAPKMKQLKVKAL